MNCVEALGSLHFITYMRTFPESTQIFCSGLNGAQLALLHALVDRVHLERAARAAPPLPVHGDQARAVLGADDDGAVLLADLNKQVRQLDGTQRPV